MTGRKQFSPKSNTDELRALPGHKVKMSAAEVIDYTHGLLQSLSKIARERDLETLAHLIDLASTEALYQKHRPENK